jgi:hypothetical protein
LTSGHGAQTAGIGGIATGIPIPIEGVGGIGGIGGIIGGRKTWGPGGIGGCGSIPIASMQQAGNGIEAGITMMIAVRLARLPTNGQQAHPVFVTLVLSFPQLHLPSLSQPHLPSSQHEHLLSLQQEHFVSHFLLLQQSAPLQHCPSLQLEHFTSYGL